MKTSALRNENSVQMSLKQLRDLHTARVENDIAAARRKREEAAARAAEMERRRLDEIRAEEEQRDAAERERERERLAAEHELELAKEKARAEAEARVLERQIELQLRQADAEVLKVQATRPRRHIWAVFAVIGMLVLGGYTWQQQKHADERLAMVNATLSQTQLDNDQAERAIAQLQEALQTAKASGTQDKNLIDDLENRIKELEAQKTRNRPRTNRPRTNKPNKPNKPKPPRHTPVVVNCVNDILC